MISAARDVGVGLSVFLGGEVVTTYEYGPFGHPVRAVTKPWSVNDRAALLALIQWEAELCPGCRQPLSETTKPEHEDRYRPGLPIRCHRCTASEQAAERYQDTAQPSALLIPVALRDPA